LASSAASDVYKRQCCDNAGFTTGIALPVDGGATAI
ncbi:short chain dehydrogenase, partial [Pseudomonas aeruginosa]|nr:short chain dehydrogenase [Pseudomonas aeruginosa]